jgi:hypothetical protein
MQKLHCLRNFFKEEWVSGMIFYNRYLIDRVTVYLSKEYTEIVFLDMRLGHKVIVEF